MVSVWLGPWDSNPALPAYQADCLTNWHRPQYLIGGKPEGRTQHWRATISRVTATPATPYKKAVHLTPFTTAASGTPLSDTGLPNAQSAS